MDNQEFNKILQLEKEGKPEEAFDLLCHLCEESHPMALLEKSMRYLSTEGYVNPVAPLRPDIKMSKKLAKEGKAALEKCAEEGSGEAMRMLAYTYFGSFGPYHEKNDEKAKEWLHKAYQAECYFAANDLSSLYITTDIEKAKYWYNIAEQHDCRVIYHKECET